MKIKFTCNLLKFHYLVMFDLASKISGVCLWDLQTNTPVETTVLHVRDEVELPSYELEQLIDGYFSNLYKRGIRKEEIIVGQEAMPTQLRGGASTVQTFIALARSHAVLDVYTKINQIAIYDYIGVYPASTHAYLKKLNKWDNSHKVTKDDIRNYVVTEYHLETLSLDESDAVFLAKTFIEVKWNKDLDEEIHSIKKHIKTLNNSKAIEKWQLKINFLMALKLSI